MKVSICVPFAGTDCKHFFMYSLLETKWPVWEVLFLRVMGGTYGNALASMIKASLAEKVDFIVLTVGDIWFAPDTIPRLVSHNLPVVCGWATNRFHPFRCHITDKVVGKTRLWRTVARGAARAKHGLERIETFGGELVVIRRDVFEKVKYPWFFGPDMFSGDKEDYRMTEDYYFCQKAKASGVELWVDWDAPVAHHVDGMVTYKTHLMPLASAGRI